MTLLCCQFLLFSHESPSAVPNPRCSDITHILNFEGQSRLYQKPFSFQKMESDSPWSNMLHINVNNSLVMAVRPDDSIAVWFAKEQTQNSKLLRGWFPMNIDWQSVSEDYGLFQSLSETQKQALNTSDQSHAQLCETLIKNRKRLDIMKNLRNVTGFGFSCASISFSFLL